jgi:hypothetical protein
MSFLERFFRGKNPLPPELFRIVEEDSIRSNLEIHRFWAFPEDKEAIEPELPQGRAEKPSGMGVHRRIRKGREKHGTRAGRGRDRASRNRAGQKDERVFRGKGSRIKA